MSDHAAKTTAPSPAPASMSVRFEAEAACDECGVYGAYVFADKNVCGSCYQGRGSCCAEADMPECTDGTPARRAAKATGTLPRRD